MPRLLYTPGTTGPQGAPGPLGNEGAQGVAGEQGLQGAQGFIGAQGAQGFNGTQGINGSQGTQGAQGALGAQGTQGTQGIQGLSGFGPVTSYVPTLSATGMTFAVGKTGSSDQTGSYAVSGKTIQWRAAITMANVTLSSLVNNNGFSITLPVNSAANGMSGVGYVVKSDGKVFAILGKLSANSNILTLWTNEKEIKVIDKDSPMGASAWLNSYVIYINGVYESI